MFIKNLNASKQIPRKPKNKNRFLTHIVKTQNKAINKTVYLL